jgi:hypothetical protein
MEKLAAIIADMLLSVLKYEKERGIQHDPGKIKRPSPLTKNGIKYKVNKHEKVSQAVKNEY